MLRLHRHKVVTTGSHGFMRSPGRKDRGVTLLAAFFVFGSVMAFLSFLGLLLPGGPLEPIWRLNPRAHAALSDLGWWGVVLMVSVAMACVLAAIGLWVRARWGWWLALTVLSLNVVGDVLNAVLRSDPRTLIGIPIGGALILFLLRGRTQAQFDRPPAV